MDQNTRVPWPINSGAAVGATQSKAVGVVTRVRYTILLLGGFVRAETLVGHPINSRFIEACAFAPLTGSSADARGLSGEHRHSHSSLQFDCHFPMQCTSILS